MTKEEYAKQLALKGQNLEQMKDRYAKGYAGITAESVRQAENEFIQAYKLFEDAGGSLAEGTAVGWRENERLLLNNVRETTRKALEMAKKTGEIHSPSRLFAREVGAPLAEGIGVGFEGASPDLYKKMRDSVNFETARISADLSAKINFGGAQRLSAASPSSAPGASKIENKISISVNGIKRLDEVVDWYTSREFSQRRGYTGE